ncbi:protein-L-histidine N-pros-methyltransferase [Brevipalpus obovatus]|uniref:protein-L-histidine N-pros-methyltransferase n=1 Tax=Brevipalpus obovatus TaxID=246614 RepID=UPI003D9DCB87
MECRLVCNQQARPIIRSALARTVYERMIQENQLRNFDHKKWYECDLSVLDERIASKFKKMSYDNETDEFIQNCYQKSDWLFTQMFKSLARAFLSIFMTATSINGLLKRGSMFVFSNEQFNLIYDELGSIKSDPEATLMDLGSGDGCVTTIMSKYFHQTYCTEVSTVMKKLLAKRGFKVLDPEKWADNDLAYDLITCLNLLDRCDQPITMMKKIHSKVKRNGRVLIALVFPLNQYVESSNNAHKPAEMLPIVGSNLEEQVQSFVENVIEPNDFELLAWTKLPYLSEGDLDLSYYWLIDVVFLLKPKFDSQSV